MHNTLLITLIALLMVIAVSRLLGLIFAKLGQPPVIGEVVGGILLGPSFLRGFYPEFTEMMVPQEAMPYLGVLAQIGIILYMFVIGLELDLAEIKKSSRAAASIVFASIALPFTLGLGLATQLQNEIPIGIPFAGFAIFIGVSMSVTAFPVLARILSDYGLSKTRIGMMALTCAAIDDATAWCLLALSVGVSQSSFTAALWTIGLTVVFVVLMFSTVKPLFARIIARIENSRQPMPETLFTTVLMGLLISAVTTELIGTHAIFGGFLFGVIIPHKSRIAVDLNNKLKDLVRVLFMPAFFAFTGMRTQFSLISSSSDFALLGLILLVAIAGKFGGTYLAARFSGFKNRESIALGALMNTRGLVELIVLNVGFDLGVLNARLFTLLVLMALLTTFATGPVLKVLELKELSRSS